MTWTEKPETVDFFNIRVDLFQKILPLTQASIRLATSLMIKYMNFTEKKNKNKMDHRKILKLFIGIYLDNNGN